MFYQFGVIFKPERNTTFSFMDHSFSDNTFNLPAKLNVKIKDKRKKIKVFQQLLSCAFLPAGRQVIFCLFQSAFCLTPFVLCLLNAPPRQSQ
jgi:hypothetical protein